MKSLGGLVLFVDDSGSLLAAIASRLRAIGFKHALFADTATEAERLLKEKHIAHVVCDWRMPSPGGIQLIKKIRRDFPRIKCTLLTGFKDEFVASEDASDLDTSIRIFDKSVVDTVWLCSLVGFPVPDREMGPETAVREDSAHIEASQETATAPADVMLQQRLTIEELQSLRNNDRKLLREITLDLVEDLHSIAKDDDTVLSGLNEAASVRDLIYEIEHFTPEGRRLIQLDRAVRRRLLGDS